MFANKKGKVALPITIYLYYTIRFGLFYALSFDFEVTKSL